MEAEEELLLFERSVGHSFLGHFPLFSSSRLGLTLLGASLIHVCFLSFPICAECPVLPTPASLFVDVVEPSHPPRLHTPPLLLLLPPPLLAAPPPHDLMAHLDMNDSTAPRTPLFQVGALGHRAGEAPESVPGHLRPDGRG